jgi:transposase
MMTEKRKTYTAEFKREAVRLVTEQRYSVAETARNLGINVNMLRRWKQECTVNTAAAFPGNGRLTPHSANSTRRSSGYEWSEIF